MKKPTVHKTESWPRPSCALGSILLLALLGSVAWAQEDEEPKRDVARTEAVVLWVGLTIVSVALLGIGLIWGVMRGAKRLRRKHEPTHTVMPDIWYLNPPGKRRQDDS